MDAEPKKHDSCDSEHAQPDQQPHEALAQVPPARLDLCGHSLLEAREELAVRGAVALDLLPELGESLALGVDDPVHDLRHRLLERRRGDFRVGQRDVQVGDVLVP